MDSNYFSTLENRNVVINLGTVLLGNTLSNPHNVAALLFLQFEVGIENSKVELVEESIDIEADFMLKELVLKRFLSRVVTGAFKQRPVLLWV